MFCEKVKPFLNYTDTFEIGVSSDIVYSLVSEVTARFLVTVKYASTFSQKLWIIWVFLICLENVFKVQPICTWTLNHFCHNQSTGKHFFVIFNSSDDAADKGATSTVWNNPLRD